MSGRSTRGPGWTRWTGKLGVWVRWAPLVEGGTLYVGTNDGRMRALDAASGEELWEADTGSPVYCAPAVADGFLYFGLQNGRLLAVRA
ncbi:PQQ-binding-like beta-propeller repeat protein [Streptomyces sp. R08]|uniref:PQQ-binding-like beta-propeller repeat protein n=1 Tax=Streptomyces sp. R08 TaxID=3238624 RepID=A0AB39MNF8_9ACTN